MRGILPWLLALPMLSGCVNDYLWWDKPGAKHEEFVANRDNCMKEATQQYGTGGFWGFGAKQAGKPAVSCDSYAFCMEARGFKKMNDGRFSSLAECRQ